jgi:predicted amidohydrolase
MRIGYFQFRPIFGRVERNLEVVLRGLDSAEADLLVLPELAFTGYNFADREEVMRFAEDPSDSATVTTLADLCRRKAFHLVTGFTEKRGDQVFNSALLIGPAGLRHVYRKIHSFNNEKLWFDEGDTPLDVVDVQGVPVGIMICFDWAFPEVTRTLALRGAQVICQPSNLVLGFCQQTMLTRCLENAVFAITANRYGADRRPHGRLRFTGKSQIAAPGGELLHCGPSQREELYITEIDPALALDKHITPLNDLLADRRPEFYL